MMHNPGPRMSPNLPYNKNSFDKYHKYPAEVVLKRVLKYAWKSKFLILISLLFLVGFTYLELLQPKLINTVLDDHLLGVQTVWVESENGDVKYNNKKYTKAEYDEETEQYVIEDISKTISIVYYNGNYYETNGIYSSSNIKGYDEISNSLLLEDDTKLSANILDKAELKEFYKPSVSPIIKLIIIYGSLTLIIIVLRYTQQIFFLTASMRLTLDIRKDAFNKLNRLPMK